MGSPYERISIPVTTDDFEPGGVFAQESFFVPCDVKPVDLPSPRPSRIFGGRTLSGMFWAPETVGASQSGPPDSPFAGCRAKCGVGGSTPNRLLEQVRCHQSQQSTP